jgi:NitT/TauT family transport system substrate-binding protein
MRRGASGLWGNSLAALIACGITCPPAAAAATEPATVRIRINSPAVVGLAPIYLALERGYFKAEGLEVELMDGVAKRGGMEIVSALTAGQLDIATIAPSAALFDTLGRGARLTGLLALNTVMPADMSSGIVVRQDHIDSGRYRSPKDLKGMRIAIGAAGSTAQYNVVNALKAGGLNSSDVEFVAMPFPDAVAALTDSSIDAAFEVEPFISLAQARGIGRLVVPSSETSLGAGSILVYGNADFIAAHRSSVESYVYALLRGQRDYQLALTSGAGREVLYAALMKYTSVKDLAQLEALHFPSVDPNGSFAPAAMDELQAFFVNTGGLPHALRKDQMIDEHFTAAALKRLDAAP